MASLCCTACESNFAGGYGKTPRCCGLKIDRKRYDWIYLRQVCYILSFTLNELRTGRLLRCECKRTGEISSTVPCGFGLGRGTGDSANKADDETGLAANEEKAQSCFQPSGQPIIPRAEEEMQNYTMPKICHLQHPTVDDLQGMNRFVVGKRKRLAFFSVIA
ncbi:hypothetical protein NL676_019270 [Syzygium grande]|nr:hypothetical protein NL676_019270 [Syzygium grande]